MSFKINVSADLVLAVSHAIPSKDKMRQYLNGVRFEEHEAGGVTMVSANGFYLIVAHDEEGTLSGGPVTLRFSKDDLRALARPARSEPCRLVSSSRSDELLDIVSDDGKAIRSINLDINKGTFPAWRGVVPTEYTTQVFHGFKSGQLAEIIKAFSIAHPRQQKDLPLYFSASNSGNMLVRSSEENIFAVAVPYRADKEHHSTPAWF